MGQVAFAEQDINPGERATNRVRLMLTTSVQDTEGERVPATIYDLSETGLLMECGGDLELGARVRLEHPQLGQRELEVVWLSGSFYGCQFTKALQPGLVASAYRSSPVVWPSFRDAGPEHRQQAQVPVQQHAGLSSPAKLAIIFGASLTLWGAAIAAFSIL